MHKLNDLYPGLSKDGKEEAIAKLKVLLQYLEGLPISKLPYVEMGFDALDARLVQRLQQHQDYIQQNYSTIELNVQRFEYLKTGSVYQELYPYWFRPYLRRAQVADFRVGNRVMNANSVMRHYLPFGARGTVVGKTEEKVIVLFDEQFLQGTTIYGHCEPYRGALLDPTRLVNLSRSFAAIAQGNRPALKKFQEKPLKGAREHGLAAAPKRGDPTAIEGTGGADAGAKFTQGGMDSEGADGTQGQIPGTSGAPTASQSYGRGQRPR